MITARYSIWEHSNRRPRSGTPAKVAREIRETVAATPPAELPRYDWVISHVWSYFRRAGQGRRGRRSPPNDGQRRAAAGGRNPRLHPRGLVRPALPESIRVVSPEELVWRIRMQHDPQQTAKLIREFP